jgi:hypothetical protein
MAKRFIVCLDGSNAEQHELFKKYIDEHKLGWWHWLNNIWLISDSSNKLDSEIIRDKVTEIYSNINSLVIELKGSSENDTWSGFGPQGEKNNMFEWLHNTWSKK